jgi:ABC-type oligopeptide transport system substrate-binding subunit
VRPVALAGALALATTLSACSLSSEQTGSPPSAPAGAHRGGVLRVGVTSPGGIDPLDAYEPAGKLISTALCDTLVTLDPETGQVREALARGWVLNGGAGMTVKLRHGVRFTDGSELRSRDVNYSMQQLASTANGAYAAGLAKQFAVASLSSKPGDILADGQQEPDVAFGVSRYDFQLTSLVPDGGSLRALAEPGLAPVSSVARAKDPTAFSASPVCVGPYRLAKPYRGGDRVIRLTRAKGYYAKNVGYTNGGTGYADEIDVLLYPTSQAALAAYDKGQVDVVQVPRGSVAGTRDTASRVYGLATGVEYVGLPGDPNGPFGDPDVRIALSQAIDRTKLVADVFGPAAQPANGFEPPALAISAGRSLRNKTVKGAPLATCGDGTPATPDLSAAKAKLAKAAAKPGAKPLIGFTLEVNDDAPYPAMARELAAQWRTGLGLDVKVVTSDWRSYLAKGTGSPGFTSPFRIRWATDATSPVTTWNDQQLFFGPLASQGGGTLANWAHFSDRAFDFALTETAAEATEVPERGADFAQLARSLCAKMPLIPLTFDRPAFLVRSTTIGRARPVPVGRNGVLLLRELYLK